MAGAADRVGVPVQRGIVATARLAWAGQVAHHAVLPHEPLDHVRVVRHILRPDVVPGPFWVPVDYLWGDFRTGRWLWGLDEVEQIDPSGASARASAAVGLGAAAPRNFPEAMRQGG